LKITGTELSQKLDKGTPRILVASASGKRPDAMTSSIIIMPYMMGPGEDRIVANAIYEGLTHPGHYEDPVVPQGEAAQIAGDWGVELQYIRGVGEQKFKLKQDGSTVSGSQVGELYEASLKGHVHADHVEFTSSMEVSGNSIPWACRGTVSGSKMSGTVHMGEYGDATWKAIKA